MSPKYTKLEAATRDEIDQKLLAAGWVIQDKNRLNLYESVGVAVREVFDEGNAFCKKITYKVGKKTAEESIKAFRTDPQYRTAVTVDMIATGTDTRPLKCVMFMRDVKSQSYYGNWEMV